MMLFINAIRHRAVRILSVIILLWLSSCSDSTLSDGGTMQYLPETTIDSLSVNVVTVSLHQELDTSASCPSKGWDLQMAVSMENRNPIDSVSGIYIWGASVLLSDSEAFVMYFNPVWNGSVPPGGIDTIQLAASVERPCMDRNFSNQAVDMFLLWTDTSNVQMHSAIDSLIVTPRY